MVYLRICHLILRQVFYMTGILYFVSVPRYGCFENIYVSRSMELHLLADHNDVLESRMFQKDP